MPGNYEVDLKRSFSFSLKAGPAVAKEYISTDAFVTERNKWFINFIVSAEFKYYFNLSYRLKLQKTITNFSAGYFSIEPFITTKSLIMIHQSDGDTKPAKQGAYINIGCQKQMKYTYINIYFGARFPGKIYENSVDVLDVMHAGITVGGVFKSAV
ncbi:MAG: hypothetical protein ABI091_27195 [Ferruginibacter sp.]